MSSEAVRVVRELFAATNRRRWDEAMALYAEDVELTVVSDTTLAGTYSGKEAVGRFYGDWMTTFDAHFELAEVVAAGDAVVVVARHRVTGAHSGITLEDDRHYAYWVRDGLIVRVEMHDTRDGVFRAAGIEH